MLSKTPEVGIRRTPIYPQYTPGTTQKFWGGGPGQDLGACAPWPQPKTATGGN